jgi:TBC1 domain family member 8/9
MSTISAQLRNFKEPDRDEQSLLFFAIPHVRGDGAGQNNTGDGHHKMEINAVLSLAAEGTEDSYVRTAQL